MVRQISSNEAARLLRIRVPHGRRKAFAEALGITPQAFSMLLNPDHPRAPRLAHIEAIAGALQRQRVPPWLVRKIAIHLIFASPNRIPWAVGGGLPEGLTPAELVEEVEGLLHPPRGPGMVAL